MRYLGIDYGSKRIGIAVSDESNKIAMPKMVLANNRSAIDEINTILCDNDAGTIVLGESKNFQGADNAIMADIKAFKQKLEDRLGKPVVFEPEFMSSAQAERFQGKNDMLDASAAAVILQSFLDRLNAI